MARRAGRLNVTAVEIRDVLGARSFRLEPGRITKLAGPNGSGKSTAMQAVQAALGGGNLAKLARVGAEGEEVDPEVVLVLDGEGSESYRVEKSGNKTARVRARVGNTQAFEDVVKPQEFLRSLYDPKGANPVAYLTAKDEDRALMLLEALPLTLDRAELQRLLGDQAKHVPMLPAGLHPLEELELVRDAVFRARTGVNRDHRGKADSADQVRRKVPATIPADPQAQINQGEAATAALADVLAREETQADAVERAAVEAAVSAYQLEEQRVSGEFKAEAAKLRRACDQRAAEIRAEAEREIVGLKEQADEDVAHLQELAEGSLDQAETTRAEAAAGARRGREAARFASESKRRDLAAAREKLATLRAQAQESAAARALHEQALQFDREAEELKAEAEHMTATITALDAFRRRLADDLPIEGLEISGRVIRVHGVPFEQLNTQQKIDIAVKVSTLRAQTSRLPVLFVDGAEALDTEHFDALVKALEREGVQAFLARVTDQPALTVETIGEAVTA